MVAEDCIFSNNTAGRKAGGVSCLESSSTIVRRCTFSGNTAGWGSGWGAGVYCYNASTTIENTIIAFSPDGQAASCDAGGTVTLTCCDLYGNAGGDWVGCIGDQNGINGNFSECPLFCDLTNDNYYLQNCSPCAPGNHPYGYDCGLIGAYDVGCECGLPSAVDKTSWSSLKALYR